MDIKLKNPIPGWNQNKYQWTLNQQQTSKIPWSCLGHQWFCVCVILWLQLHKARATDHGPWEDNMYMKDITSLAQTLNKTNCWICRQLPATGKTGLSFHGIPFNETGYKHIKASGNESIPMLNVTWAIGTRIQEQVYVCFERNHTGNGTVMGVYPYCKYVVIINQNMTWGGIQDGKGTELNNATRLIMENDLKTFVQYANISNQQMYPVVWGSNCWWLCGRKAYSMIPLYWNGQCTLGYALSSVYVNSILVKGCLRNRRNNDSPLSVGGTWYTQAARGAFPPLGVAMNYRDIHLLNNWTIAMFNSTITSLKLINRELSEIREVALQNRYALDIVLAAKGGVCALIHNHCCTYIHNYKANISHTIQLMEDMIKHNPLTTEPVLNPWEWLWSWLPDSGWLKTLVPSVVAILILFIGLCCCIQCIPNLITISCPPSIRRPEVMMAYKLLKQDDWDDEMS